MAAGCVCISIATLFDDQALRTRRGHLETRRHSLHHSVKAKTVVHFMAFQVCTRDRSLSVVLSTDRQSRMILIENTLLNPRYGLAWLAFAHTLSLERMSSL